jgi:hypothetical protein
MQLRYDFMEAEGFIGGIKNARIFFLVFVIKEVWDLWLNI